LKSYLLAGQFVLDEDSTGTDAELLAHQIGVEASLRTPVLERPVEFLSAFSYYTYPGYANSSNFLIGGTSLARGNPNVAGSSTALDAEDFDVIEIYNELAIYPYGFPTRFFLDYATNPSDGALSPSIVDENDAFSIGVALGKAKKKGEWEISYAYKRLEANSVVGAFTDSDFGAAGHIDKRGSVIKLGYALTDNLFLNGAAFFVNNLNTGTAGNRDEEQRRFQLDMLWKF
jgi:hypothetical protein